jgi:hypothetical protein
MPVRFFGQFLLDKGIITKDQLAAALSHQERSNLRVGETALSLGLLTREQLDAILALQRVRDYHFGEAAIFLGFLRPEQVERVLSTQRSAHVKLGEALVSLGVFGPEALDRHLAAFADDQAPFLNAEVRSKAKDDDPRHLTLPAAELALRFMTRLAGLNAKLLELREDYPPDFPVPTLSVRVRLTGFMDADLALRASVETAERIASGMLSEPVDPQDVNGMRDAMSEFLTVVAGNLCDAQSAEGRELEVSAPLEGALAPPGHGERMWVAHLGGPDADLEIIFATRNASRE